MKILDQGHLHPLLERAETNMSRPVIEPWLPASQASTLAKSYLNGLNYCYTYFYIFRPALAQGQDIYPQSNSTLYLDMQNMKRVYLVARSPVLVAEYLNGERHWQSLNNYTCDEVCAFSNFVLKLET
jgi:hypothetical protein